MPVSLERRIERLNQDLAPLKEEREKLNLEAKKRARERDVIHEKISDFRRKAADLKEKRDDLNERVQELKNLRNQTNTERKEAQAKFSKLKEELRNLTERKPLQSMRDVETEIERIEWRIQTTSLPVKEEEKLIDQVRQLEAQLFVYKKIQRTKRVLTALRTDEKTLDGRAESYHKELSELAQQSQGFHERMLETLNEVRDLQIEADTAHQEYVEIRKRAQSLHKKCVDLSDKIKTIEKDLQEAEEKKQAKRQRELRKELEKVALEKMKRGEKLTWEEFKLLAEKGRL